MTPTDDPKTGKDGPKRILLLDDEPAILAPMARYFTKLGCCVDKAAEPEEADALIVHRRYDLAILDLQLTRFANADGLEILREIRKRDHWTSVIILSAYASPEVEEEAIRLGRMPCCGSPSPFPTSRNWPWLSWGPRMTDRCLIDRILEPGALSVRFQPVYEIGANAVRWHYVECLIRGPQGTSVEQPEILFEYARRKNREAEVDRACVATILDAARCLPESTPLGINVHASTLAMDPEFLTFLGDTARQTGTAVDRLVIEIVEHAPPWDVAAFRNSLDGLRSIGAKVALDDVGLGQSNFMMILECRPSYFKIDRYFVHGAPSDFYRRAVLACVAQLALPFAARVVAEGVETEADLDAVRAAGIDLAQGYLFGEPGTGADLNQPDVLGAA